MSSKVEHLVYDETYKMLVNSIAKMRDDQLAKIGVLSKRGSLEELRYAGGYHDALSQVVRILLGEG